MRPAAAQYAHRFRAARNAQNRMLVDGKTGRNGKIGSFAASTAIFLCFFLWR